MRKTTAILAAARALLLGIAAASPALAKTAPLTQLCSPSTNGGTLVSGVCVLPGAQVGLSYEAFIDTSNGAVNSFTIVSGSIPPGISLAGNGTQGTILAGTPSQDGTFTFTVPAVSPKRQTAQETYSIAVTPAPPLAFFCSPSTNGGTLVNGVRSPAPRQRRAELRKVHPHQQRRGQHLHDRLRQPAARHVHARNIRGGRHRVAGRAKAEQQPPPPSPETPGWRGAAGGAGCAASMRSARARPASPARPRRGLPAGCYRRAGSGRRAARR